MDRQKVALVTGANGGIGRAIVSVLTAAGYLVLRTSKESNNDQHFYCAADLGDTMHIARLTEFVSKQYSGLDLIVNNAGFQICKPIQDTYVADWDEVFAVNVRAPFMIVRNLLPFLTKCRGSIVNIASVHAFQSSKHIAAYAASKAALVQLTRSMAIEFGPLGIRANAILPGGIDTPMLRAGLDRAGVTMEAFGQKHLRGSVGRPEEIASVVEFLADNKKAGFITGQALVVDGGVTTVLSTEG